MYLGGGCHSSVAGTRGELEARSATRQDRTATKGRHGGSRAGTSGNAPSWPCNLTSRDRIEPSDGDVSACQKPIIAALRMPTARLQIPPIAACLRWLTVGAITPPV